MKSTIQKTNRKAAFTIIELLTVMSIIVLLFGLLMPALNQVRRHGKTVNQQAQMHAIEAGLEMFHDDFEDYPSSNSEDTDNTFYPGAAKLAEALVGQDLLGFHPQSLFQRDGENDNLVGEEKDLYPESLQPDTNPIHAKNLKLRKGPYIPVDRANAYSYSALYGDPNGSVLTEMAFAVLCDSYPRVKHPTTGKRMGMPILYYRARTSNVNHYYPGGSITMPTKDNDQGCLYTHWDNLGITDDPLPWSATSTHPFGTTPDEFYKAITNDMIVSIKRPYNPDTYILISAGYDGLYGTDDDIYNFDN